MTDEVLVKTTTTTNHGWEFRVKFLGQEHRVNLSTAYWRKLTHEGISPMELIRLSIGFAYTRHVAETLPERFDVEELASRISDFERRVRKLASVEAAGNPR